VIYLELASGVTSILQFFFGNSGEKDGFQKVTIRAAVGTAVGWVVRYSELNP
jgi:hypothetical protein